MRIALAHKNLAFEIVPVHLRRDGGEQHSAGYRALNPQGLVPLLVDGGTAIAQSLAICEYLEETRPARPLLPGEARERAAVRSIVAAIACDIHPIDNLRVLQYLKRELGHPQETIDNWYRHWIRVGFEALEKVLAQRDAELHCVGAQVSLADAFLVPQVANARRLQLDLEPFPRIRSIDAHLRGLEPFQASAPERQPDYEAG